MVCIVGVWCCCLPSSFGTPGPLATPGSCGPRPALPCQRLMHGQCVVRRASSDRHVPPASRPPRCYCKRRPQKNHNRPLTTHSLWCATPTTVQRPASALRSGYGAGASPSRPVVAARCRWGNPVRCWWVLGGTDGGGTTTGEVCAAGEGRLSGACGCQSAVCQSASMPAYVSLSNKERCRLARSGRVVEHPHHLATTTLTAACSGTRRTTTAPVP